MSLDMPSISWTVQTDQCHSVSSCVLLLTLFLLLPKVQYYHSRWILVAFFMPLSQSYAKTEHSGNGAIKTTGVSNKLEQNLPQTVPSATPSFDTEWNCETVDACSDKLGFEAVLALHSQLDDDANGNIDIAESDEFLRDELQYENGYERQKGFHGNDKYITVVELWMTWKVSEVHNWTEEETIEWLVSYVELPQYVKNFQENAVDGAALPRMASSNFLYLSNVLGIKDAIHKHKIALKAMDVVLFGPPKHHNYVKDVLLVFSLVIALGGCWFAFVQHKYSQKHMQRMIADMESLQNAEMALIELQKELDKARQEQENVVSEKQDLLRKLEEEINVIQKQEDQESLNYSDVSQSKVNQLEEELQMLQNKLAQAENALHSRFWVAPTELQDWLQMTYELELKHYNAKRNAAEQQLNFAKEGCEKLRKKRSSFMGAFRVAHGSSIDDVDSRILLARAALSEVTKDFQERLHRWKQIELFCGFPIVNNPGLSHLEALLLNNPNAAIQSQPSETPNLHKSGSDANLEEDNSSYTSGIGTRSLTSASALNCSAINIDAKKNPAFSSLVSGELKSSVSSNAILQLVDNLENDVQHIHEPYDTPENICEEKFGISLESRPVFTLGGESSQEDSSVMKEIQKKMLKSYSHDNNPSPPRENRMPTHKLSMSESCLSSEQPTNSTSGWRTFNRQKKHSNVNSHLHSSITSSILDEETLTDSNSPTEDEDHKDKKKRTLFSHLRKRKSKLT